MTAKFDPAKNHRRSIRLKGYDYSQSGAYFITICTRQRENLFGQVQEGMMHPNRLGGIVQYAWQDLPRHYPHVTLDAFCLMPNHVHGIIVLVDDDAWRGGSGFENVGGGSEAEHISIFDHPNPQARPYNQTKTNKPTVRHALPEIVRAFKSFSARRINAIQRTRGNPVWQRNYYEHVIRDMDEYQRIVDYIQTNPMRWDTDIENPDTNR